MQEASKRNKKGRAMGEMILEIKKDIVMHDEGMERGGELG